MASKVASVVVLNGCVSCAVLSGCWPAGVSPLLTPVLLVAPVVEEVDGRSPDDTCSSSSSNYMMTCCQTSKTIVATKWLVIIAPTLFIMVCYHSF
jgi:hypothetical protein